MEALRIKPAPGIKNRPAANAPKIANLRHEQYMIRPRSNPLLSRIITSCTMVSSRCVFGSSTGILLFSTRPISIIIIADSKAMEKLKLLEVFTP